MVFVHLRDDSELFGQILRMKQIKAGEIDSDHIVSRSYFGHCEVAELA